LDKLNEKRGNEWADQAARQIVKDNIKHTAAIKGERSKEKWSLITLEEGRQIDWINLPRIMSLRLQMQRAMRLTKSTKMTFEHGQGMYMAQSRMGRSLAFKGLKERTSEGSQWHYAALQFMMNKIITRDFLIRMSNKTRAKTCEADSNKCPVCWIKLGRSRTQTKEHILSGDCVGTRDIKAQRIGMLREAIKRWGANEAQMAALVSILLKEEDAINCEMHSLVAHGKAACLMGMWSNDTIMRAREFLVKKLAIPAETARLKVMALMEIVQQNSLIIMKRFSYNREVWVKNMTVAEEETGRRQGLDSLDCELERTDRRWILKNATWNQGNSVAKVCDSWEGKAVISDRAKAGGCTEEEIRKQVSKLTGKRKAEWNLDLREYKAWEKDLYWYNQVVSLLYASKRTRDGGRNLKRKIEREGEEAFIKRYKQDRALQHLIDAGLNRLCGPEESNRPGGQLGLLCDPQRGIPGNKVPCASNWSTDQLRSDEN